MLTARELRALLEALALLMELRSAQPTTELASDLTVAVRALERAYSLATASTS